MAFVKCLAKSYLRGKDFPFVYFGQLDHLLWTVARLPLKHRLLSQNPTDNLELKSSKKEELVEKVFTWVEEKISSLVLPPQKGKASIVITGICS